MYGDRWITLTELAEMFRLTERSLRYTIAPRGLPLRRITPYSKPGLLESEFVAWIKTQPLLGDCLESKPASNAAAEKPAKGKALSRKK